ncbi:uncharacterized protein LOC129918817 [Episyrphus balteatus]|uniref:uncharacterized protein LOC129918817 n=1 Tax=Episyrphus balteatus TaxID=286459 RepID=UPI0024868A2B|nr:uncharacterized protein LOC129918817 [Episyrphus balteatus]
MKSLLIAVTVLYTVSSAIADVSHILNAEHSTTTHPPPANPYVFSYAAGRAPGHVDRTHTEVSDGSGVIRGAFSYVDPRQEVRTVQYTADEYGFHPELSHEPEDTEANKLAKERHFALYNKIAEQHANPELLQEQSIADAPHQSEAVVRATKKHMNLFDKIAAEHAAIGAAQLAERIAFEATSEANLLEEQH